MRYTFSDEENAKKELANFILNSNRLSMDQQCFKFEKEFAKYQGRKDAVLFNSGASANLAMLQVLKNLGKLKDGDKVGFSALTWSTNVMPILQLGLVPVAIDCDPNTINCMSYNLEERIKETKLDAFFSTNVLGFAGDIDVIQKLCDKNNIICIEDNCESLGTEIAAGKAGNFSLAASFSFFVGHHMSTIEGGMVVTDDEEYAEMLRVVRANGWDRNLTPEQQAKWRSKFKVESEFQAKYTFFELGYNLRPTEITGFLGLHQLKYVEENTYKREDNYLKMEEALLENGHFIPIKHDHISVLANFAFPMLCKTPELRDKYVKKFMDAGVEVRPMIAGNMQRQPFYDKYVEKKYNLPGCDFIHECGFYCGNRPELTEEELSVLINCIKNS
jgi:CDP-6-deoxy-D-xylo-4-hexulose-3-dehydrase